MDGNGRWAELRHRPRTFGHIKGARVAKQVIEWSAEAGIPYLTLYAFSTENWQRPQAEVSFIFLLIQRHLKKECAVLIKNNIKFKAIGQIDRLPQGMRDQIARTEAATAHCTGMRLNVALSYGGRQEIVDAAKSLAEQVASGQIIPSQVTEQLLKVNLQTGELPDPDIVIRTSGESRLSNFLLWQSAYSELYISDALWPDFDIAEFTAALESFGQRERRFGKIKSVASLSLDLL
jgi:undecaprenyl diphosphate synthase